MLWARTDWMSERVKFIAGYLEYEACFSDLCRDFGISRRTGYKWVRRYNAAGVSARCGPVDPNDSAPTPALGATQGPGSAEKAAQDGRARGEHDRRHPQAQRPGASEAPRPAQLAVRRTTAPVRRAEHRLVCRLQRRFPDGRGGRRTVSPAHDHGWVQSLSSRVPGSATSAASLRPARLRVGVPGVRSAASDPHR